MKYSAGKSNLLGRFVHSSGALDFIYSPSDTPKGPGGVIVSP